MTELTHWCAPLATASSLENEGLLFSVLEFCCPESRSAFLFLSKWHNALLTSETAWKWRLVRLHVEKGVYSPPRLPPNKTWKSLFFALVERSSLWEGKDKTGTPRKRGDRFKIEVSARFKPKSVGGEAGGRFAAREEKLITLPLHQRLALIRMSMKLSSNREALQVLTNQGGWFGGNSQLFQEAEEGEEKVEGKENQVWFWSDSRRVEASEGKENRFEAHATEAETIPRLNGGVHSIDNVNNRVIVVDPTKGLREFPLDNVMKDRSDQSSVYDATAMPLVSDFVNGFNATCLVYGQTGSGKTHTMFGLDENEVFVTDTGVNDKWGIVPRACAEVFEALNFRKKHVNVTIESQVSLSYVEVYGNDVIDLLRDGALCGHSKVAAQRYVLDGSAEVPVQNLGETFDLLNTGEKQKRRASTAMNERSSRAHALVILTLRQTCSETGISASSRLFLADLGGSEQVKKSLFSEDESMLGDQGIDEGSSQEYSTSGEGGSAQFSSGHNRSERMREAVYINLGLLALKKCVQALNSRKKKAYVPYADSKLTMMLSAGLGGDSKTAVVICAAQEEEHRAETIAAIRFGQFCGNISTTSRSKASLLEDLISNIDGAIARCEEAIKTHERWEVREERRIDRFSGADERVEIRKTTVLVGAEDHRRELEHLLRKKAELTGTPFEDSKEGEHKSKSLVGFGTAHQYGMGSRFIHNDNANEVYSWRTADQKMSESDD